MKKREPLKKWPTLQKMIRLKEVTIFQDQLIKTTFKNNVKETPQPKIEGVQILQHNQRENNNPYFYNSKYELKSKDIK